MREDARLFVDQRHRARRRELGDQSRGHAQREQQQQQVLHRDAQAGQQGQGDHCSGDQAGGAEEVQAQAQGREQLPEQRGALGDDRQCAKQAEQAFVGLGALGQA
ncbi:hypothetical protein D3C80_1544010 [compost metagenome]